MIVTLLGWGPDSRRNKTRYCRGVECSLRSSPGTPLPQRGDVRVDGMGPDGCSMHACMVPGASVRLSEFRARGSLSELALSGTLICTAQIALQDPRILGRDWGWDREQLWMSGIAQQVHTTKTQSSRERKGG